MVHDDDGAANYRYSTGVMARRESQMQGRCGDKGHKRKVEKDETKQLQTFPRQRERERGGGGWLDTKNIHWCREKSTAACACGVNSAFSERTASWREAYYQPRFVHVFIPWDPIVSPCVDGKDIVHVVKWFSMGVGGEGQVPRLTRGQRGRVSMFKCNECDEPCFKWEIFF